MKHTPKKVETSFLYEAYKEDLLMKVMVWMLIVSTMVTWISFAGMVYEASH